MLKIITAIGILLLLPSVPVVYWCYQQEEKQLQQCAYYQSKCKSQADDLASIVSKINDPAQFDKMRRDNPQAIEKMRLQQHERLLADIDDLASGDLAAPAYASFLYGSGWMDEVNKYRSRQQTRDIAFVAAAIAAGLGGLMTAVMLVIGIFKFLMIILSLPGKFLSKLRSRKPIPSPGSPGQERFTYVRKGDADPKLEATSARAMLQEVNASLATQRTYIENTLRQVSETVKAAAVPLDDTASKIQAAKLDSFKQQLDDIAGLVKQGCRSNPDLSEQTTQMSQTAQTTLEQTKNISKTVEDFAAQFNAIRDYAAYQQQRLARLEDGYDWNILKHFGMRVIRSIDNLDGRIAQLENVGVSTEHLRLLRDELAFVLESSGVEAFGAAVGSEYRGQENRLQVVDDKIITDDPRLSGRIAQMVRPGYQCVLSEEKSKIVRPAQVRLYMFEDNASQNLHTNEAVLAGTA